VFDYETTTGRLRSRTDAVDGKTFVTTYSYDANDNLQTVTYPAGRRVEFVYDEENRVTRVRNPDRNEFYAKGIDYHPSGALSRLVAGNQIVTAVAFDPKRYWVTSVLSGELGLTYGYDNTVGNLRTLNDLRDGTETYGYDTLDRLTCISSPMAPANCDPNAGPVTASYTYDAHGNRKTAAGITYTYKSDNPFQLQSDGSFLLDYDNNGNVKTASQSLYTYTPENRLATAQAGATSTRFTYDADDWRLKKAVDNGDVHYYVRGPNGALLTDWFNNGGPNGQAEVRDYIYAGSRLIAVVKTTQAPK
jgi:YD repeat-containing protein